MRNCKCQCKNFNNNALIIVKLLIRIGFLFNKYLCRNGNLINIISCFITLLYNYSAFAFDFSSNTDNVSLSSRQQLKISEHLFRPFNHFSSTINVDNNNIKNNKQTFQNSKTNELQNNFFNGDNNLKHTVNSRNIIFDPKKKIENEDLINEAEAKIESELFKRFKNPMQRRKIYTNEITSNENYPDISSIHINSNIRDTAKCFSCMSKLYEGVWPALSHIYKRPLNFTDACNGENTFGYDDSQLKFYDLRSNQNNDYALEHVPVQHCSTICVGMREDITVAGVKIRAHIRGCLDDVLHSGFNDSIITIFRWMQRDSCRDYRKRELFKLPADQSDDSTIHVCTCYADHCNAAPSASTTIFCDRIAIKHIAIIILTIFLLKKFNCLIFLFIIFC